MEEIISKDKPAIQSAMTTAMKDGVKTITHPSGVVNKYTAADIQRQRAEMVAQRDRLNEQIAVLDKELTDLAINVIIK
jgi:hypothetical protein